MSLTNKHQHSSATTRNSIISAILLSILLWVGACKLPSDSISSASQSSDRSGGRKITNPESSLEVNEAIQKNLVDMSLKSDFEVQEGILHFRDLDTYIKVRDELRKISITDRVEKTKIDGFTSLLALYQEYFDKNEKNQDTEQYRDIISKVGKELSKENKQEFLNSDFVVSALINRAGLVYIGKILYKFSDKQQETILDGDILKIGTVNKMVRTFNSPTSPITKQARAYVGDRCASSWTNKYSTDQERQIALDVHMRTSVYATGSTSGGIALSRWECQPTAFAVPYKKNHRWDGS